VRGSRQRRTLAIFAAFLWLLGIEALPDLHLATHHHDHTHAADGSIVADDHDEAEHEDEHGPSQLAFDHLPHHHAASGIAHHATALHQPPPPLLAPIAAPTATTFLHAAPTTRTSIASASRPVARGPPVA
jgi:hypothetical protein